MDITLKTPNSISLPALESFEFKCFLQLMVNRSAVGYLRYGKTKRSTKFLTRMKKELKAYEKTGNMEQLVNVAVYCFLESYAPENRKFHFDPSVDSVTR